MNFKTTYILFGLLVGMIGLLAIILVTGPTRPDGADTLFPSMNAKDVALENKDVEKITIEQIDPAGPTIVLERDGEKGWKITAPRTMKADENAVTSLISNLKGAKPDAEKAARSLAAGGLDKPRRIVRLAGKDREWALTIGYVTPGTTDAIANVMSSDAQGVAQAVRKASIDSALEGVGYFRQKKLLGSVSTDIDTIKISEAKKGTVELKKNKDRWRLVQPPYGDAEIGTLLNSVTDLDVFHKDEKETDFVEDAAKDLAKYGLDPAKDPVLRVEVVRGEGKDATSTALLIGKKDGAKYFATLDDGQKEKDIVKVAATGVEAITKVLGDPGSLRNKNLLVLDGFREPDAIDVENSYRTSAGVLEFRRPDKNNPWELFTGKTRYTVDEIEVRKLLDELKKPNLITSFPDPMRKKELGLEKPEVVVKVWADSLDPAPKEDKKEDKKDAKKDDKAKPADPAKPVFKKDVKPLAELRFGNVERDMVAVERIWGDDHVIVFVPRSLLDQVRKGPLEYIDKSVPSFNPGGMADENVTKIELTRPGETYEIARATPKDPWKIVKPDSFKDRKADDLAIRDILGRLNRMNARGLVAEKAEAKELAQYDLVKAPYRVAITLTKNGKPATFEYLFGKDEPGKGVYTKLGDKDTIYRVESDILETLRKELRDTTVLNFDPDKVQTVTVKGWHNLAGDTLVRSFQRKDNAWEALVPKGFNLDASKVTELVQGLARLRADKFVPAGKGLTLKENGLVIELTLQDKTVLELTVGAADGDAYFATSSQAKGETFLISKSLFEKIREKPAYFGK